LFFLGDFAFIQFEAMCEVFTSRGSAAFRPIAIPGVETVH